MNSNTFIPDPATGTNRSPEQEAPCEIRPGRLICTRVAGVTFYGRQAVVARLSIGEEIRLCREPSNCYDPNAIRVERMNGQQIGYLNRHLAAKMAPFFDAHNQAVEGQVNYLTGARQASYSLGVVILFNVPEPDCVKKGA